MIKTSSAFFYGVALGIALGAASTVHAATFFSANLSIDNETPNKAGNQAETYSDSFSLLLNVNRDHTLPTTDTGGAILGATGTINTNVQFGGNDLRQFGINSYVDVGVNLGGPFGYYNGTGIIDAKVQDTWYLNAVPRYVKLRVKALWDVNGELIASLVPGEHGSASASSIIRFYGSGVAANLRGYNQVSTGTTNGFSPPPTQILLDMVFQNGVGSPYNFEADTEVDAGIVYADYSLQYAPPSAIATAHFGHTFTWGGITSVSDADTGEEITDWTLTSESGLDWAHAFSVPEPSCLLCALAAAFAFGAMRRRSA